jgi:hypothetical protein
LKTKKDSGSITITLNLFLKIWFFLLLLRVGQNTYFIHQFHYITSWRYTSVSCCLLAVRFLGQEDLSRKETTMAAKEVATSAKGNFQPLQDTDFLQIFYRFQSLF